jgi:hypothetical protein
MPVEAGTQKGRSHVTRNLDTPGLANDGRQFDPCGHAGPLIAVTKGSHGHSGVACLAGQAL